MSDLCAPTYWNPRFFARIISLGAWATTYSLSGCYSILAEPDLRAILGLEWPSRFSKNINTDLQDILHLSRNRYPGGSRMAASNPSQFLPDGDREVSRQVDSCLVVKILRGSHVYTNFVLGLPRNKSDVSSKR